MNDRSGYYKKLNTKLIDKRNALLKTKEWAKRLNDNNTDIVSL